MAASDPEWFKQRDWPDDAKRVRYHGRYYKSFVESVQNRAPSIAPIEDAVRSDALSHLSLLAIKRGSEVTWDPQAYKILAPGSLNEQMAIPVRGDWQQG